MTDDERESSTTIAPGDLGGEHEPEECAADRGFARGEVADLLADRPRTEERRVALRKLNDDQLDLLGEFVDGFETRRGFLEWCQRASVLSLGELPGEWFVERSFSALDMSTLLVSDARYRWSDRAEGDVLVPSAARDARRGVAAFDLLPAFSRAHERLRWNATEYVNDRDDSFQPDAEEQRHPAMRPALTVLQQSQAWALGRLFDGFAGDDALLSWCHTLTQSSFAEMDSALARRFYSERHTRDMLLGETDDERETVRFFRESVGAKYLLPAFARAAREVGERAGELAEQESDGLKFPKMG
jgi:hypothetical protein